MIFLRESEELRASCVLHGNVSRANHESFLQASRQSPRVRLFEPSRVQTVARSTEKEPQPVRVGVAA
jgi:hypothetical protein